ncbi:hypothetical protein PSYPI_48485, partial [Pseudomonas syringae pv. pisi str. 1704B]
TQLVPFEAALENEQSIGPAPERAVPRPINWH